jgi:hypothetical protein
MKHMAYGKAALLGVFVLAGCYSYASEAINNGNYNTVQASPNFVVIKVGDSDRVIARLINDNNNGAVTSYTVSGVGAGIRVDSSCTVPDLDQAHQTAANCNGYYRPIFDASKDTLVPTGDKTAQQFFVLGLAVGQYTFTLTPTSVNTGVSRTVTVVVTPTGLGPALSKTTAVAGDTVTITAPTGTVFSQTSAVTFGTGSVNIIGRSADSTTITFQVSSNITGPATVTLVGTAANPAIPPVTLVTTNALTTPSLVAPTIAPTTQVVGGTVVLTAAPNTAFSPSSAITITSGPTPPITARSADSSTISFIVGPGDSGAITVTNVAVKNAPALPVQTLTTSNSLNLVPPITVAPTTLSTTTPPFGTSFTVTLAGGLRFTSTSTVKFGNTDALILSTSADSSSAVVMPFGGTSPAGGLVSYTNIVLSFLNTVPLTVVGDQTATIGAPVADPNTNALATAPTITPAASGGTIFVSGTGPFNNAGECAGATGDGCQLYKVVVTTPSVFDVSLVWSGGQDMGLYLINGAGTTSTSTGSTGNCDAHGQDTPGESCTYTLAPGTYYFAVVFFGTGSGYGAGPDAVPPTYYQFSVKTH